MIDADALSDVGITPSPPGDRARTLVGYTSVQAWQQVRHGAAVTELPIAAHAELDPTGTAITGADYARTAFIDCLDTADTIDDLLRITLRPYQIRGVAWLRRTVAESGGALLADDMGLGKTLQAIGLLAYRAHTGLPDASGRQPGGPHLVVAPAGLVSNWTREINRYAPTLRPRIHLGGPLPRPADGDTTHADTVVITSYARLRRDAGAFTAITWGTVIFDEAQALKNPRTQLARVARDLPASGQVALTGTPIENSLDDIWAILRVVAPHVFPHRAVFRRRYVKAHNDGDVTALPRLRAALARVMLARTKEQALPTLPPKMHTSVLCDLTEEQAQRYDAELADLAAVGFGDGLTRHGRLLAALTRLKQICNHPGLLTGDTSILADRSGKLDVCTGIITRALQSDSPVLVFTQYRATGELLTRAIAETLGVDAPFYHGGLSASVRAELADGFQSGALPPVMVMSVKAGGVGLTLTRAREVIHFDRWWNPAVEAQASDRVHRIGQEHPVTITTLTTATTIEEHIDDMHRRKASLHATGSDGIVAELARLDDDRLLDVLRRSRTAGSR